MLPNANGADLAAGSLGDGLRALGLYELCGALDHATMLPSVIPKGNNDVRKGNVRLSIMRTMARDTGWTRCIGTWDRLRWARLQRFATAKDFAAAVGEEAGTYRAIERAPTGSKHIELDHQRAFAFAKRLGVRWEWLLMGDGEPWLDADENRERILRAYDEAPADRRETIAEAIEKLLKAG